MSGEQYEIIINCELMADLIQKINESLTHVMNRCGLNQVPSKALWTGSLPISNGDRIKMLVSLNTRNARVRLAFPDHSIPKHECEHIVKNIGSELFQELSRCGVKTPHVVQKTGQINVVGIPCG